MLISVISNGVMGFGLIVAALFCLEDIQAALATPTGFPMMAVLMSATNSVGATTAMVSPKDFTLSLLYAFVGYS